MSGYNYRNVSSGPLSKKLVCTWSFQIPSKYDVHELNLYDMVLVVNIEDVVGYWREKQHIKNSIFD